ncbi:rRNA 2'-O-methyltransferase fibrillarin-like [Schizosaccharomyces osmophilus]|uniref:rRNA 2'-O-methyltransferase fibrillarin-like n=1 Tax=Schizosaccharomyces osmophilus TaxID=2545709 RepID=A0AAE9W618_9SCHI|nr:rRNA 2'-O-methyltransferase fibrillarin-like [Schizosaccharomyces osmophilus]WBW70792.1 rRNA 2'-O-methyltransferase fibrillarin-like [Schizosaccharomyces osmophilus]
MGSISIKGLEGFDFKSWGKKDRDIYKELHIYDFDNTLFQTPLPNANIWSNQAIRVLMAFNILANGGWFFDPRVLASTGEGVEVEEKRAWDGWWNEKVVAQARESIRRQDVLAVLLTGRNEQFRECTERMVKSKGLYFDGLVFKIQATTGYWPETLTFKLWFFEKVFHEFPNVHTLRVYEDRPSHVEYFSSWLAHQADKDEKFNFEIIAVTEPPKYLKFSTEIKLVKSMIASHNAKAPSLKLPLYKFVKNVTSSTIIVSPTELHHLRNAFFHVPITDIMQSLSANSRRTSVDNEPRIAEPDLPPDTPYSSYPEKSWIVTAIGRYRDEYWAVRGEVCDYRLKDKIHEPDTANIPSLYGTIMYISMSTGIVTSEITDIGAQQWRVLDPSERWLMKTYNRRECTHDIRYKRPYTPARNFTDLVDLETQRASPFTGTMHKPL